MYGRSTGRGGRADPAAKLAGRVSAYALSDRELVLDRYRALRPLGRGGSGSVWLSRDERTGLDVALKIVPREGKRAARALREMEAATRLRHPHCVRAFDYGEDEGHVYIAYEYVQGRTLREELRAERLSDAQAVEVSAQVLDALAHAHARGIVHRDVKPSNVLVEEGPEMSAKLLDFGLAQFDEADTLTAMGDVPGTLAYISPERLRGAEASERSDVWSVGVMLWEALARTHPFWGIPLPEVAGAIESGAEPLAGRRPDLPPRLLATVDSALSIDAGKRPTASRLAAELREDCVVRPRTRRTPARSRKAEKRVEAVTRVEALRRSGRAGLAAAAAAVGASLLPFWPPGLIVLLALAAALTTLRSPRAGLVIVLATPVLPLGNLAQAAAVVYAVCAAVWLAVVWRDARAGLVFTAGPLLAAVGLLALLPLAVQPARGAWRRALHAAVGVLTAVAIWGLGGRPLPLAGATVSDLGLAGSEHPFDVVQGLTTVLQVESWVLTTALALALSAVALPYAVARGPRGIAALGIGQAALVLLWGPAIPWAGPVLGTAALCGILVAWPRITTRVGRPAG